MIVVAASDNNDSYSRANFSDYSTKYVDVSAPGVDIYTTSKGNKYDYANVTSLSTPFVAGAAALLKSIKPSATARQIKNAIIQGADKRYATSYTRYGFLDVSAASRILQGKYKKLNLNGTFAAGKLKTSYNSKITVSGGYAPYSWSITYSGTLPPGLKFYVADSDKGLLLTGTPLNFRQG